MSCCKYRVGCRWLGSWAWASSSSCRVDSDNKFNDGPSGANIHYVSLAFFSFYVPNQYVSYPRTNSILKVSYNIIFWIKVRSRNFITHAPIWRWTQQQWMQVNEKPDQHDDTGSLERLDEPLSEHRFSSHSYTIRKDATLPMAICADWLAGWYLSVSNTDVQCSSFTFEIVYPT